MAGLAGHVGRAWQGATAGLAGPLAGHGRARRQGEQGTLARHVGRAGSVEA
ncbi:hypothetical protein QJS04_geneDACA009545 [Acorus gramineus]|uniref:Uncharacterized protein n=1 Tax=Acorus gramineus TaxID=55184 RepID=A0AAV9AFV0_ACOGR|nr:hypothetical protein QJS04_geneDACA009545 [Acorus gramineus]